MYFCFTFCFCVFVYFLEGFPGGRWGGEKREQGFSFGRLGGPGLVGKVGLGFACGLLGPQLPLALNFELADGQGLLFFAWPRPFFLLAGRDPLQSSTPTLLCFMIE